MLSVALDNLPAFMVGGWDALKDLTIVWFRRFLPVGLTRCQVLTVRFSLFPSCPMLPFGSYCAVSSHSPAVSFDLLLVSCSTLRLYKHLK